MPAHLHHTLTHTHTCPHTYSHTHLLTHTLARTLARRLLNKIETFEHPEWAKGVPDESQLSAFMAAFSKLRAASEGTNYKLFTG